MYSIGWFSTGRDAAARELLSAVRDGIGKGEIKAEILFVFSDREEGEAKGSDLFFELVRSYQTPLVCFSSRKFEPQMREKGLKEGLFSSLLKEWRLAYDREVMRRLEAFRPELSVLAGYMLIVGGEMCRKYDMANLHPAVPGGPAGTWREVIWQLMEERALETGVMMHLVTGELDKGPPVTYCKFPLRGGRFDELWRELEGRTVAEVQREEGARNPLFRLIREHGVRREIPLIIATIKAFAEGKVRIERGKVLTAEGEPSAGYCLTEEIERIVATSVR